MATTTQNVSFVLNAADRTKAAFGSVRSGLNGIGEQLVSVRGLVGGLVAALGVGSFAAGVKSAAAAADTAAKMGDRFGIATEKLIGMQHAGQLAGASNESMGAALRAMAKSATDAARGSLEASRAYEQLGIKADQFVKLPMDQQLSMMIDKLGKVENVALRNALAQEAMGKSAGDMMGLVAEGSEAFRSAARDAQAWGLAINRVDAAKIEMANDAMTRVQAAAKGLFTTIAVHLAPWVHELGKRFADAAVKTKGFKSEVASGMENVALAIGTAIFAVQGLQFVWAGLKFAVAVAVDAMVQALAFFDRAFVNTMNSIADSWIGKKLGLEVRQFSSDLVAMADWTAGRVAELGGELDELALGAKDLDAWQAAVTKTFKDVADKVDKAAKAIAKSRGELNFGGDADIERDKAVEKKEPKDTFRDKLAQQIERIREANLTELQLLDEKLREKNILLQNALEAGLITEKFGLEQSALLRQRREEQELQHQARLGNIHAQGVLARRQFEQMNLTQQAGHFFQTIGDITAASAQQNRKMFDINKAAGIGQAIVNTHTGVTKAYAQGGILGFVTGALVLAAGMLQVAQIRKTQFGQGTSAPSIGGGMAMPVTSAIDASVSSMAPPQFAQKAEPKRQINVTYVGSSDKKITYDEMVNDFIPLLNNALDNGVDVRLTLA